MTHLSGDNVILSVTPLNPGVEWPDLVCLAPTGHTSPSQVIRLFSTHLIKQGINAIKVQGLMELAQA